MPGILPGWPRVARPARSRTSRRQRCQGAGGEEAARGVDPGSGSSAAPASDRRSWDPVAAVQNPWPFGLLICFGFRVSDFGFAALPRQALHEPTPGFAAAALCAGPPRPRSARAPGPNRPIPPSAAAPCPAAETAAPNAAPPPPRSIPARPPGPTAPARGGGSSKVPSGGSFRRLYNQSTSPHPSQILRMLSAVNCQDLQLEAPLSRNKRSLEL